MLTIGAGDVWKVGEELVSYLRDSRDMETCTYFPTFNYLGVGETGRCGSVERFAIIGGVPLQGKVLVNGAKNATLPIMAATVLAAGRCTICDAPYLRDVMVMTRILEQLGAEVKREGRNLSIDTREIGHWEIAEDLMRETRSSIFLMGALLARKGKVKVAYPGGCNIGPRPIDLHLKGLRALNVRLQRSTVMFMLRPGACGG